MTAVAEYGRFAINSGHPATLSQPLDRNQKRRTGLKAIEPSLLDIAIGAILGNIYAETYRPYSSSVVPMFGAIALCVSSRAFGCGEHRNES